MNLDCYQTNLEHIIFQLLLSSACFQLQEVPPANEVFLISRLSGRVPMMEEDAKSRIFQDGIGEKLNQIGNIPAYVNDVLFGKMIILP